jgi:two-component system response regulator AtoC
MNRPYTEILQALPSAPLLIGLGPAMRLLHDMVSEVARTDIPVLIAGESGTGKDAYARLLHQISFTKGLRFLKCNCASFDLISEQLRQSKVSRSEAESCGTLYLDNVQELDSSSQRMLLSLLPDGENTCSNVEHIGRLVSSATSSLESDVEFGRFRPELYFRLNGACLRIPSLRERVEDIPVLTEHFLSKHATAMRKDSPHLNEKVTQALAAYHWPGNIRELENFVRKAVLFGDFQIALNELQLGTNQASTPAPTARISSLKVAARAASKKAERELILQALERTHWNRKRAARDLQISYKSLLYKIKQIGVSGENHER